MFRYLLLSLAGLTALALQAQKTSISGFVTDSSTANGIANVSVLLRQNAKTVYSTGTNENGYYYLLDVNQGTYDVEVRHLAYSVYKTSVQVNAGTKAQNFNLAPLEFYGEEVVVQAIKATSATPITQTNLTREEIEANYSGQDIPTVLNVTPSINSNSDAGNGMGYSYFRIRGIDQTRINMTINGVPINDPENQGFYTNNFADLASSAEQIQVQRGVGTTTTGAASFGGSVNVTTKSLADKAEVMLHTGYGSYNSKRNTVEFQTGRVGNGKFAFYGRFSDLASDGYRQNSATQNRTFFFSGGWFGKKDLLKLNVWGGRSQSQLAYLAIDKATYESNRTLNPLTAQERDEFRQNFFQLQYSHQFNSSLTLSASAYYVKGYNPIFIVKFYETPYSYLNMPDAVVGSDTVTTSDFLTNYRLNQDFYGGNASLNYSKNKWDISTGVYGFRFISDHFMQIPWAQIFPTGINPEHEVYFNTGTKDEASAFAKASYKAGKKLILFADLQVRHAQWSYKAKAEQYLVENYNVENMSWNFINPKIGARYQTGKTHSAYLNIGMTGREPTRFDYLRDDRATRDIKQNELKAEQLTDIEAGWEISDKNLHLKVNVFNMMFQNQLANTGLLNAYGAAITANTGSGTRQGVEIEGIVRITPKLSFMHTSCFSKNVINSFTQYYVDDSTGTNIPVTYTNTAPALTPQVIMNNGLQYRPVQWLTFGINSRYVSKQYIDNTQTESLSIPSYQVLDAAMVLRLEQWTGFGEQTLSIKVNNLTDARYAPAGAIGSYYNSINTSGSDRVVTTPTAYFPAAGRNVFVTLALKF